MALEKLPTEHTVNFNVQFVDITGSINAALLLSQLCYLGGKGEAKNIFYRTVNEIQEETGLTRYEQETALKTLVAKSFVSYERRGIPAKRCFTIHWKQIEDALVSIENKASVHR